MYGGGIGRDRTSRSELVAHTANKSPLDAQATPHLPYPAAVDVRRGRHNGVVTAFLLTLIGAALAVGLELLEARLASAERAVDRAMRD